MQPTAHDPLLPRFARDASAGADLLARTEWLLANGLGGFAMGTASGIPTRRYHAWLVAALRPPVGRVVMLSGAIEQLVIVDRGEERRFEFSSFAFRGGNVHPGGVHVLSRFEKDAACRWTYRIGSIDVVRELILCRGDEPGAARNACIVRYRIRPGPARVSLRLRPLTPMRDFHALRNPHHPDRDAPAAIDFSPASEGFEARSPLGALRVRVPGGVFSPEPEPWRDFEFARDLDRGQDGHEDVLSPGWLSVTPRDIGGGEFACELRAWADGPEPKDFDQELAREQAAIRALAARTIERLPGAPEPQRRTLAALSAAARQFVVHRETGPRGERAAPGTEPRGPAAYVSIIAGYPWFSDWGRDSMISLQGLLLTTGLLDEARRVLETFAGMEQRGLIPNCFDNGTGHAEYNTVDASLWFLHAACRFLEAAAEPGKRPPTLSGVLRDACLSIIRAYRQGTDHGIAMDPSDGLIAAGDPGSQLTWMDAKRDGVVFTPRHGKPVEINALWYNGLLSVANALPDTDAPLAADLRTLADKVRASFVRWFWDDLRGCLHDVIAHVRTATGGHGWHGVPEIRPNQIFAVSLPHSPLDPAQRRAVVACVRQRLLTPMGLRTLDPASPRYRGRFEGDLMSRDGAYHNGTVWPWLLGPYAEAVLRAGDFSNEAREEARAALQPLLSSLDGTSAGSLPEVYDGDHTPAHPQRPDGCMMQAWSVAEPLRIAAMLAHSTAPTR